MRVFKKVNNVESSWRISFVVSHPIREQVLLSLYWPNQVDKCSTAVCNIEERGEEQREEIPTPTTILQYCDIFFLSCHIFLRWKNQVFAKPEG